jgi:RNA polymerase sigma factor (sigma-70 family)
MNAGRHYCLHLALIGMASAPPSVAGLRRPSSKVWMEDFLFIGGILMAFETLVHRLSPTLKRIAYKLERISSSAFDHDDLYQEALSHLWLESQAGALADKTDSYILQGCYFFLKNYLRVHDKRRNLVSLDSLVIDEDTEKPGLSEVLTLPDSESLRNKVHCDLLIEAINNNGLTTREKEIFWLSLEGSTTREIGQRLGISHVMVVKLKKSMRNKCLAHMDK